MPEPAQSQSPMPALWRQIADDVIAHVPPDRRPGNQSKGKWWLIAIKVLATSPGFRLCLVLRVAIASRLRGKFLGRIFAVVLRSWIRHWYHCDISASIRLHGGLILPHPLGIVIGPEVEVGPNSFIFQNVTLGGTPGRTGAPTIGANARIYAGAVVAGPVQVGDNVAIGANAVVLQDVPPNSLVKSPQSLLSQARPPAEIDQQIQS